MKLWRAEIVMKGGELYHHPEAVGRDLTTVIENNSNFQVIDYQTVLRNH
jgi:hypothetical protein